MNFCIDCVDFTSIFLFYYHFKMSPSSAFCRKCEETHRRPVGRNCQRAQVSDTADISGNVAGPSHLDLSVASSASATSMPGQDVSSILLQKLTAMQGQLNSMDERIRRTEAGMSDRTTERAPTAPTVTPTEPSVAKNFESSDSLVPSVDFLRTNSLIQQQVEACLQDYHTAGVLQGQGKLRSQRSRNDVPIKRFAAWPHHYVVSGNAKEKVSYDQLKPTQWMAGALKAAMDLPRDQKDKKNRVFGQFNGRCFRFRI